MLRGWDRAVDVGAEREGMSSTASAMGGNFPVTTP